MWRKHSHVLFCMRMIFFLIQLKNTISADEPTYPLKKFGTNLFYLTAGLDSDNCRQNVTISCLISSLLRTAP